MHGAGEEYDNNMGWWKFLNFPVYESWQTAVVFVTPSATKYVSPKVLQHPMAMAVQITTTLS